MAQANVAREPSMEEILASIRKIIESNDPAEEHDAALDEKADLETHPPAGEQPLRPLSLLNRIPGDAVNSDAPKLREPSTRSERVEPPAPLRPGLDQTDAMDQSREDLKMAEPIAAVTGPEASTTPASVGPDVHDVQIEQPDAPEIEESEVVVLPDAEHELDADEQDAVSDEVIAETRSQADTDERRALISPAVGARIATSFGNLSHAVTNGPSRSFDEIAEDMLRPMLQQWMDDNLPTLVERLVREEIERVARGR